MVSQPGQIFIGRQHEMAQLRAALDEASSGRGQVIMLAGEPGVGKTRLADELATHAQAQDYEVLWGSCYEGDGAPPYWPWITAIASYVELLSNEQLASILSNANTGISEILPQITQKLPDLAQLPALGQEQARFRLFDSVAAFLSNSSISDPLLIILEDLHWADYASLMLLEFVTTAVSRSRLMPILNPEPGGTAV